MAKSTNDNGGQPATGQTPPEPDDVLGDAGKRALQAERERAKKAEADAKAVRDELAKLKADDDAKKSQMDQILAKLDASEKRSAEAERRAMLGEVVAETGLSMAKVSRLKGDTIEELMADATEVFEWKPDDKSGDRGNDGAGGTGGTGGTPDPDDDGTAYVRPKENLTAQPGQVPEKKEDETKIAEQILSGLRGF